MHEKEFQENVIKALKTIYPKIYLLNTSMRYTIGVPDLLIGLDGKFIGIELKVCYKLKCTIQHLFPKSRKQIATLSQIENSNSKGYGLVYFSMANVIMLFRIDFEKIPLEDYENFFLINNTCLCPIVENPLKTYYIFKECWIDSLDNLSIILKKTGD